MSGCVIISSLALVSVSWLTFSIHFRQCQPSSKFLVLHTIPGLFLLVSGLAVDSLHQSVTSHCLHHLTTGVAIMILLPSSVRNFQAAHSQGEPLILSRLCPDRQHLQIKVRPSWATVP